MFVKAMRREASVLTNDEAEDFIVNNRCLTPQAALADFKLYGVAKWWYGTTEYTLRRAPGSF